ncbi:MAG: hypothetical protein FWG51_05535, partial [Firmicutes bacterium]|nr:hypothetical protein [Bacillota bacterium]
MAIKHYFAAGLTSAGFVNYFDYINNSRDGYRYILKGGPGTGKSTLIKKTGRHFEKNSDIEYFYCASDPESLDGVFIVSKNVSIVDGTAPHVIEAKMPKVQDEIINLGEFIDSSVCAHKDEIEILLQEKKRCFNAAEHYLRAAGEVYKAQNSTDTFLEYGKDFSRKLFLSALDKNLSGLNKYKEILVANKADTDKIRRRIDRGGRGIFFSFILDPEIFEAIEIDGVLIQNNLPFCKQAQNLLQLSKKELIMARAAHKQIESFYKPYLDLSGLNKTAEYLIKSIEQR